MEQRLTNETEPEFAPITIGMEDGYYRVSQSGYVDVIFSTFEDLMDFLAETLPEIKEEH